MYFVKHNRKYFCRKQWIVTLPGLFINLTRGYYTVFFVSDLWFLKKYRSLDPTLGSLFAKHFYVSGFQGDVISTSQINNLLRKRQQSVTLTDSFITQCDIIQLSSNKPSEDRWFASRSITQEESFIFGVLDGHGGEMCAHNVSQRLPSYVATFLELGESHSTEHEPPHFTNLFREQQKVHPHDFCADELCQKSLKKLLLDKNNELKADSGDDVFGGVSGISKSLEEAFLQLDMDLHSEALASLKEDSYDDIVPYLTTIQSGCCTVTGFVKEDCIVIANTGDCRAVAGVGNSNGLVSAMPLSLDQTTGNPHEISRILSEHPEVEAGSLFSNGRLLGILTPFRAFGDAWLKWDAELIKESFRILYGPDVCDLIPMFYRSPPYLTAQPVITHYHLPLSGFKFVIFATDGLWDLISNEEAILVVENHLRVGGRTSIQVCETVDESDHSASDNAATALVRYALGGENMRKLASMLSLPFPQVRMYRDDITVMVLFF